MLAEILNVVQVFTPAFAVTVCYCCYCCSAVSKQKGQKTRVKPENTWGFQVFSGKAGRITRSRTGHCTRVRSNAKNGPPYGGFISTILHKSQLAPRSSAHPTPSNALPQADEKSLWGPAHRLPSLLSGSPINMLARAIASPPPIGGRRRQHRPTAERAPHLPPSC